MRGRDDLFYPLPAFDKRSIGRQARQETRGCGVLYVFNNFSHRKSMGWEVAGKASGQAGRKWALTRVVGGRLSGCRHSWVVSLAMQLLKPDRRAAGR